MYDKYRIRKSIDFAVLAVAGTYRLEDGVVRDVSLVLGAVAPVPHEDDGSRRLSARKEADGETAAEAAEIAMRHAIALENNGYKIDMAKVMVRRFLGF